MVRHIVMWKLDNQYNLVEKSGIKTELKTILENLSKHIPEIKSMSVTFNSADADRTNFDICLDTSFNSFSDLKTYQVHPEHLKAVEFIRGLKLERACIDYEY